MDVIDILARSVRAYDKGILTAQELVDKFADHFAGDADFDTKYAADAAALIPPSLRTLMVNRIDSALSPEYLRQPFAMEGRRRTEEEERAAALCETAREKAWAVALKPLLS
jgi:hypothetical protein